PKDSLLQTHKPRSSKKRQESSINTKAVGKKKRIAAKIHKLMEDVPLCAAAATQRGPSTQAMLNSSTSQKPITRRNCCLGSALTTVDGMLTRLPIYVQLARQHTRSRCRGHVGAEGGRDLRNI